MAIAHNHFFLRQASTIASPHSSLMVYVILVFGPIIDVVEYLVGSSKIVQGPPLDLEAFR